MKQSIGDKIYRLEETSQSKNTLLNMAEIISGALTTSENDSTTETKGIELVIEHIVDEFLGFHHDWQLEDATDEYVRWVNFGVGGPA